jgi:flagellar hook-associated protein 3 FlgL
MTSSAFISTNSLTSTLRLSAMKGQVALSKASKEATTGREADVGLSLGALSGRDVVLRAEITNLEKITDTNELVAGRLDTTQGAMSSLTKTAQDFVTQLLAARGTETGASVMLPSAQANLSDLVGTLNQTLDGQYIFAGINTAVKPVNDYTPTSASKAAVDAAFVAQFGMTQSNPGVNTISGPAMQTFLDTTFANLFASPAWNTTWSSASDQTIRSRISPTETVESSVSANEDGMRKLAQAYVMVQDLGTTNMNQTAFQAVVDTAVKLASAAISELTLVQGKLGNSQQRTTDATTKLASQKDLLTSQVDAMEKVDPTEASVRVTTLQNQIETSMALISRIQKLSILNYI